MVPGVKGDLKQEIFNEVSENVKALEKLFPSAVKDGQVDFQALKEELGQFEEVGPEKYGLTWAGKQNAKKNAQQDLIGKTLKYIEKDSKNQETTENLYIEGDNLEVLKLLRQNYYGAIKMIYIDPPYNTGNDFVYNDNFNMDKTESDIAEGDVSELGERYKINSDSTNRYHANWLNMMYPRLKVAKDLLKYDGVIFISIDDNEMDNLKKICDEIFGETNYVGDFIKQSKVGGGSDSKHIAKEHEVLLVYAKEITEFPEMFEQHEEEYLKRYKESDERGRFYWDTFARNGLKNPINYDITAPDGTSINGNWIRSKERFEEEYKNGIIRIISKQDGNWSVQFKQYLNLKGKKPRSMTTDFGGTIEGKKEIEALFKNDKIFSYPKSTVFLQKLFKFISLEDNSITLDFFSGSSTTAHAVMQLNLEDGGNRKFIMVQIPEETDEKSEARKAGYNNICEIGRARIDKAGDKIKEENKDKEGIENLDIGFKVFRVSDTNIRWEYESENLKTLASEYTSTPIIEQATFNEIAATGNLQIGFDEVVSPKDRLDFMPGAKDIDVVYEILLRQRDIPLSAKVELLSDIGARTYIFADSFLVCLEEDITKELIEKLAAINPLPIKFILRDSAFGDDIALKDETYRRLTALIERNSGESKKAYTVEFI